VRRDLGRAETALVTLEGEDGPWRADVNFRGATKAEDDSVLEDELGLDVQIARKKKRRPGELSLDDEESEKTEAEELTDEDWMRILVRMLRRLRDKHWYCIYCGVRYESQDDLDSECPGEEEELH
jgi:hypothetical protein